MAECNNNINIVPALVEDKCKGRQTSTDCILHELAITYLSLPPNSTLTEVINALLISLVDTRNRVATLENEMLDLTNRVIILEI